MNSMNSMHSMSYKTHNTAGVSIDLDDTHLQGAVSATLDELTALFGQPSSGDGHKTDAHWAVQYQDGTVASVYNYKNGPSYLGAAGKLPQHITSWNVGGFNGRSLERIQIGLDLLRESQATRQPQSKVEEAFSGAHDMMSSIVAAHGQMYADAVEVALLMRKHIDLFQIVLGMLVKCKVIAQTTADTVGKMDDVLCARMLSLAASHAGATSESSGEDIMAWAERIHRAESAGTSALLDTLRQGNRTNKP